jgi:DNA-binding PadR family transcriptional regulator
LSIISILARNGSATFNQFKAILGGTDGTLYAHLEKLVKEDYIAKRKEIAGMSAQTVYTLTETGKKALNDYLAFMEDMIRNQQGGR